MLRLINSLSFYKRRCYTTEIRQDKKWNHLRDNEMMKKRIGDFIELPVLPGELPKGLERKDLLRFLLTEQRWQLVDEVIGAIGNKPLEERTRNGLCLSGPHGVGKSAINYFLACIAFVRGWFLQYIPLCGSWAKEPTDNERALFYINRFETLNEGLLESVTKTFHHTPEHTLADVLKLDLSLVVKQARLETFLSTIVEKPVLYLFDEHNELWKSEGNEPIPARTAYFRTFTSWTRLTGPRLYIIYSGSAHSKFEYNLPSGEDRKVRYIHPFKKEEACKLIEDLKIPKKFSLISAETVYDEITGGVPRQIVRLSEVTDVDKWRNEQIDNYYKLARKTYLELNENDKGSYIAFLDLFYQRNTQKIGKPPTLWYDKGLFYINDEQSACMLNSITKVATFYLWAENLQKEMIDKPERTGSEEGAVFEREVIKAIIHLPKIELQPFYITKLEMQPGLLKISRIEKIVYFDREDQIPSLPTLECQLLIPNSQIFKSWDFIIEDAHTKQIVFVQTTIQFPDKHDKNEKRLKESLKETTNDDNIWGKSKMARAFITKNGSNQIQQILDTIFHTTGTKAYIDKNRSFIVIPPVDGWTVKFLCITSKSDIDVKNQNWKWENVLFLGRESISPLNLCWSNNIKRKQKPPTLKNVKK